MGIEVAYSLRGYLLSQSKYVAYILEWVRLTDNKTIDTPIEVTANYSSSDGVSLSDPTLYRTIVKSLVYLTITHPDIAYVVHVVSKLLLRLLGYYSLLGNCSSYFVLSSRYSLLESSTFIHLFFGAVCILRC